MSGWPELVSVALLGTERREPPTLSHAELSAFAGEGSSEERLLAAAGAVAVYRRAGRAALAAPALPAPSPGDERPACGPAATSRLSVLLGDRRALLPEWLRALAATGARAPAEHVPDLLQAATATPALQAEVEAVLGERGRWLAVQEPRWAWAAALPDGEEAREQLWATGERPQRRRLFALIRGEQPQEARALLEQGLAQEEPEDRAWFVSALADGLSIEDEPLLEAVLADRRQEARTAAASLLSCLPGSGFAQRMRERALPLVQLEGGRRKHVRCALPEDCDEAMARDGIVRRPPQGTGRRAWWLEQLVGWTPLSVWGEIGLSPERVRELQAKDAIDGPLLDGLARAAWIQCDPQWGVQFLDVEPRMAAFVGAEAAVAVALAQLGQGGLAVARQIPAPWPRALSEAALALLAALLGRADWQSASVIAERLDPALAPEALRRLSGFEPGSPQARRADEILATLSFRRDMHEELR
ncbi:MAG: DUF5691 domain-containing protein [Actinomycetota bacterium]|nr:DUF5691 domain-containing protein [Actinomycetota bacterium]